ncbi:MAG: hypothetical protein DWQ47_10590 [Acidobacteria bacterium]|nr:MAG: hypothetical protein DWQ32_13005 [Acidobacteriota bacterium]REJ98033.1 MAG: hypothetical protein DWQ38_15805 [Acidobacteriota bacterium]REK16776.1 MAG: hypothetical protein DWQ43_00850 [Acidobacteriota bacterium]REK42687.1 MAG: hypothetical protein DWQ47_10590 [Acidobacteriota bacterium]
MAASQKLRRAGSGPFATPFNTRAGGPLITFVLDESIGKGRFHLYNQEHDSDKRTFAEPTGLRFAVN